MTSFFKIYTFFWMAACLISVFLYIRQRRQYALSLNSYQTFLLKPWKVATFILSAAFLIIIAPYTGDATWDYYDTALMSILTFLTAPWAVGVVYRFRVGKANIKQLFVAACAWMFSASWSYDIYMYLREGYYPATWWPNIILSSILYLCAGLLWSLDWKKESGIFMSFKEDAWPAVSKGKVFSKIFIAALPFASIVLLLCGFVIYGFHSRK